MAYTIDESLTDTHFTPARSVAATFGTARRIESITIHHWGSLGQTHSGVVDFFVNRSDYSSAHFVVSDGKIHCLVSPANASWAAGNAYGNATSVHIECRPEATEGDYNTVAWLIKFLRDNYGANLPLIPHNRWTPTQCPGKWDLAKLDRLARGTVAAPAPVKPAASTPVKAPAKGAAKPVTTPSGYVAPTGLSWVVQRGDSLAAIARHYGISVPTLAGYNKINAAASLKIGLRLHIPGPLVWVVEPGDTLGEIAKHYAMDIYALAAKNGIRNINSIAPGQVIKVL